MSGKTPLAITPIKCTPNITINITIDPTIIDCFKLLLFLYNIELIAICGIPITPTPTNTQNELT